MPPPWRIASPRPKPVSSHYPADMSQPSAPEPPAPSPPDLSEHSAVSRVLQTLADLGVRGEVRVLGEAVRTAAAAAEALGIDEVWALGGPQAIGWLAYVRKVDKIVGPGNAYVNEAKLEVSRDVAIDLPGGPSEVVVVADESADPRLVELELAAQAEHGHEAVCKVVSTLEEAEAIAPEHLVLLGDAERHADRVRNAGTVFVGPWSPVPAGDYATGGNHVLPTNGWARSVGGLGLETFLKPVTVQRLTKAGLQRIAPTVEALAAAEGLPKHAEAVRRRT